MESHDGRTRPRRMSVVCTRCRVEQEAADFYSKGRNDKRLRMPCKRCRAATQRAYQNTDAGRAAQRSGSRRYEQSDHGKSARAVYNRSASGKAKSRRYHVSSKGRLSARTTEARYLARHPERKAARKAVAYAVATTGGIFREEICAHCGKGGKTEAHHHRGYAREFWLDVVWLCPPCHRAAEQKEAA